MAEPCKPPTPGTYCWRRPRARAFGSCLPARRGLLAPRAPLWGAALPWLQEVHAGRAGLPRRSGLAPLKHPGVARSAPVAGLSPHLEGGGEGSFAE